MLQLELLDGCLAVVGEEAHGRHRSGEPDAQGPSHNDIEVVGALVKEPSLTRHFYLAENPTFLT